MRCGTGWILALAALLGGTARAQSHHPGAVVLLGEEARAADVPELAAAPEPSVLLIAGEPESPAPLDARHWGGDQRTELVQLPRADEADPERALLERLRRARLVALGPGSPRAWLDALLARERASAALSAVHEAWSRGATLVGRGDSAALLSAAFVVSGPDELGWEARNPRDPAVACAGQGLGYQPWALIDTGGRAQGRLERLFEALVEERMELALFLPARAALVVDLERARLRVHGAGAVLLLDARRSRRLRGVVEDVRLSLLPTGTAWNAAERRVDRPPLPGPQLDGAHEMEIEDVHAADALALAILGGLEEGPASRWVLRDARRSLRLRWDPESRWGRTPDGESAWVQGLATDLGSPPR